MAASRGGEEHLRRAVGGGGTARGGGAASQQGRMSNSRAARGDVAASCRPTRRGGGAAGGDAGRPQRHQAARPADRRGVVRRLLGPQFTNVAATYFADHLRRRPTSTSCRVTSFARRASSASPRSAPATAIAGGQAALAVKVAQGIAAGELDPTAERVDLTGGRVLASGQDAQMMRGERPKTRSDANRPRTYEIIYMRSAPSRWTTLGRVQRAQSSLPYLFAKT